MTGSPSTLFAKGLMLHITNPKAVLFFGSLYSMGIPAGTLPSELLIIITAVSIQSFAIFHSYALVFSSKAMTCFYLLLRRIFEGAFALGFGVASMKILTARVQP